MEGVGDDVLVEVVAQVAVETGADVLVDRLQLDEDQQPSLCFKVFLVILGILQKA
jgi:hypothetical protein